MTTFLPVHFLSRRGSRRSTGKFAVLASCAEPKSIPSHGDTLPPKGYGGRLRPSEPLHAGTCRTVRFVWLENAVDDCRS